jgi:hypothetical protein
MEEDECIHFHAFLYMEGIPPTFFFFDNITDQTCALRPMSPVCLIYVTVCPLFLMRSYSSIV